MNESQTIQEESGTSSSTKWILLIVGGGCVLLACIILVIALAVAFFFPITRRVVSEANEEIVVPPPEVEVTFVPQPRSDFRIPESRSYPLADDNALGNPDAPVTIIVYSDFQCIYCMQYWEETEPLIIENYIETGQVYYIYRSFGDFLGPQSGLAAEAAYCAGDQGVFWLYHDTLFLNWTGEGSNDFSLNRLRDYADALGLDMDEFTECLENDNYGYRLEEDVTNARADDVRATPSFLINGELVEGAQPYSIFRNEIEAALENK